MMLLKKEQGRAAGLGVASYAPIAQAMSKLPAEEKGKLRKTFDIAYFVATERSYLSQSTLASVSWRPDMEWI